MPETENPFLIPRAFPRLKTTVQSTICLKLELRMEYYCADSSRFLEVGEISHLKSRKNNIFLLCKNENTGSDIPARDEIRGARGCTPESCSYRDHYLEFRQLGCELFGVSTKTIGEQKGFEARLNVPYEGFLVCFSTRRKSRRCADLIAKNKVTRKLRGRNSGRYYLASQGF